MAKSPDWSARELAVVDRHARALGRGRYPDALAAARACRGELARLRKSQPSLRPRSLVAVHFRVLIRAHAQGRPWARTKWGDDETRRLEVFVQAYLRGEYPSVRTAARACHRALPARVRRRRSATTVYHTMFKLARVRGLPRLARAKDRAEIRVLDRYTRLLFEGRFRYVREAAPGCLAELERLRRKRPDARHLLPRTLSWVNLALARRSAASGLPRYRNLLTPAEHRLLERFARKVDRGELPDWLTAARECLAEIRLRYGRPPRRGPGDPRRLTSHSLHTIHDGIRELAHRLNLRGPRCIRWSAEELKLLRSWVRWYRRYRGVRRLYPLKQASEGLREDIAKLGITRTVGACQVQLTKHDRLMQGGAKAEEIAKREE